jgi:hypothetical protein
VLFWGLLAVELLFIGLVEDWRPWSWLVLLTLPALAWLLHRRQRDLQSRCVAFLDAQARESGLTKLDPNEAPTKRGRMRINLGAGQESKDASQPGPPLQQSGEAI